MNNDLSRITEETDEGVLPYLIWYPSWADVHASLQITRTATTGSRQRQTTSW